MSATLFAWSPIIFIVVGACFIGWALCRAGRTSDMPPDPEPIDIPQQKSPLAESAEVCCPQRRAHSGTESKQLTGSRNPEIKHEARRALTSELGQNATMQEPAGFPAPAGRLLAELEIDMAVAEYLLKRGCPTAQPVIILMDSIPPEDEDPDPDWDELTAKVARLAPAPGQKTFTERMLDRMDA